VSKNFIGEILYSLPTHKVSSIHTGWINLFSESNPGHNLPADLSANQTPESSEYSFNRRQLQTFQAFQIYSLKTARA
jgi:hypothetical protein